MKAGHKVSISGFPGEKNGYLYEHTDEIMSINETELGGYIISYKVDTTPGMSGSAI